jgi:hypothetical protein
MVGVGESMVRARPKGFYDAGGTAEKPSLLWQVQIKIGITAIFFPF